MTAPKNVPTNAGGCSSATAEAGAAVGGPLLPPIGGTCVACGHTAADHVEEFIGAAIGDDSYCHVDDHSCYVRAQWDFYVAASLPGVSDTGETK